jgi:hypothetical protein
MSGQSKGDRVTTISCEIKVEELSLEAVMAEKLEGGSKPEVEAETGTAPKRVNISAKML